MSVFWQHVGNSNARRDLPRTIGTPRTGLREFHVDDVRPFLSAVSPIQDGSLQRNLSRIGQSAFQIWGLPAGAKSTLSKMTTGDYLMLLDTNSEWGAFRYIGRVLHYLPAEHWELSLHLWKERSYPLIAFCAGSAD
jgi:hypothetical protein